MIKILFFEHKTMNQCLKFYFDWAVIWIFYIFVKSKAADCFKILQIVWMMCSMNISAPLLKTQQKP